MNPQDKVERVLKEMHVMFSKSLEVGGMPDKMVVDRVEYMNLLDRLTNGIYEMMEEYEQTRSSRMAAERSFRRNAEEIIEQANSSAEDIYAASMLYTADAIGKIRALMDQTNDSMNELFIQFRREMRNQKDMLRTHESELQAQLADLSDTRKYLSVLRDINREQERKNRDLEAEREIGNQYARNLFRAAVSSEQKSGDYVSDKAGTSAAPSIADAEVTVNRDADYFKWKARQNGAVDTEGEGTGGSVSKVSAGSAGKVPESGTGKVSESASGAVREVRTTAGSGIPQTVSAAQTGRTGSRKVMPVQREPEREFPNDDAIYQPLMEDERRRAAGESTGGQIGGREVIKTLIFGRDQE